MRLFELLKNILDDGGIRYIEKEGSLQFAMYCGAHMWNVAFTEDEESFLKYYARYPWGVSAGVESNILSALNRINESLRAGCFMISGGYPVFRYGVYIFDEFTAKESISDQFLTASAKVEAEWDHIYAAVNSGGKLYGV